MDQHVHDYVPCRVCGWQNTMEVLDLGMQPLANDFRPTVEDSHQCERHPLRLMRCRKCNHAQLSTMVDRKPLFTNYTYRSATSRTLDDYFTWLAEKVDEETGTVGTSGPKKVLELALKSSTSFKQTRFFTKKLPCTGVTKRLVDDEVGRLQYLLEPQNPRRLPPCGRLLQKSSASL